MRASTTFVSALLATARPPGPTIAGVWRTLATAIVLSLALAAASAAAEPPFLMSWGSPGSGPGEFNLPWCVTVGPTGRVLVVDSWNRRLQWFTPEGAFLETWGSEGTGLGQFATPVYATVAPDGTVYVTDQDLDRVTVFSPDGVPTGSWGTHGSGPGEFDQPEGIALDRDGNVYVCDNVNRRVQVFTPGGSPLREWTLPSGPQGAATPRGIAIDSQQRCWVTANYVDAAAHVFTTLGEPLFAVSPGGSGSGTYSGVAIGLCETAEGGFFVLSSYADRVLEFDSSGDFLLEWGTHGDGPGQFWIPTTIAYDGHGRYYVSDYNNNRIEVFGEAVVTARPTSWGRLKGMFR